MPFPKTQAEMVRAGYYLKATRECSSCGVAIEWWITSRGKSIPFDVLPGERGEKVIHWADCPNADKHRAPKPTAEAKTEFECKSIVSSLNRLRNNHRARIAVLIAEDGRIFAAWADRIPADDLRGDLVNAANFIRSEVPKGGA